MRITVMSQNIRVLFQFHSDFSGNIFRDQEVSPTEIIPTSDLIHPIIVYYTQSNLQKVQRVIYPS